MEPIYLDYNATTPVREEVLDVMSRVARDYFANPSSAHGAGRKARELLEVSRRRVADAIGAEWDEILFTSGGSESDNLAIRGLAARHAASAKDGPGHIITTCVEHPAVSGCCAALARSGFDVTVVDTVGGRVDPGAVASAIRPDTFLLSVMWANNEAGQLQPVDALSQLARDRDIRFHTDAVQAFGKVEVDVRKVPVDMLALSGHKFYGPKGIGILYLRRGVQLEPQVVGGSQERGVRAGTENLVGAAAIAEAAALGAAELGEAGRLASLRDRLEAGLLKTVPDIRRTGDVDQRLPNTSNIAFRGVAAGDVIAALDREGIAVSGASACHSGSGEPSESLIRGMGLTREEATGSIRFSFGRGSTSAHVDRVLEVLPPLVRRLRAGN